MSDKSDHKAILGDDRKSLPTSTTIVCKEWQIICRCINGITVQGVAVASSPVIFSRVLPDGSLFCQVRTSITYHLLID